MTRRELREQIFKMLFGTLFHGEDELSEQMKLYQQAEAVWDVVDEQYITDKCNKVAERIPEIDAMVNDVAQGWKTVRMGKVDLTIIRLAVYEMKHDEEVPVGVAINEAVELAKIYGAEDSPAFINGILAKLV